MTEYSELVYPYPNLGDVPLRMAMDTAERLQKFVKDNFGIDTTYELRIDAIVLVASAEEMRHLF